MEPSYMISKPISSNILSSFLLIPKSSNDLPKQHHPIDHVFKRMSLWGHFSFKPQHQLSSLSHQVIPTCKTISFILHYFSIFHQNAYLFIQVLTSTLFLKYLWGIWKGHWWYWTLPCLLMFAWGSMGSVSMLQCSPWKGAWKTAL